MVSLFLYIYVYSLAHSVHFFVYFNQKFIRFFSLDATNQLLSIWFVQCKTQNPNIIPCRNEDITNSKNKQRRIYSIEIEHFYTRLSQRFMKVIFFFWFVLFLEKKGAIERKAKIKRKKETCSRKTFIMFPKYTFATHFTKGIISWNMRCQSETKRENKACCYMMVYFVISVGRILSISLFNLISSSSSNNRNNNNNINI